jgi:hypothetical protein
VSHVKKVRGGTRLRLEPEEAALLRALTQQLLTLLGEPPAADDELAALGIAEDAGKPADPVLARLLPDAYREDPDAAGEFRRYTEVGLRDGKRAAAGLVLETLRTAEKAASGGELELILDREQAQIWLRALNDVRLALGTRLDITEEWYEEAAELDWQDPRYAMFAAYDWLTMLQESMVRAVW